MLAGMAGMNGISLPVSVAPRVVGLLVSGLAIVWLAPNSQALARYTVDRVGAIRLPSPAFAFAAGAMLAAAIMGLDRVSTFLYYQF
jgi:hypothetical protein